MKNSIKVALVIGFLVAGFGFTLSYCTSKPEKPIADTQDSVKVENPADTTAQETAEDSTSVK